MLKYKEVEKSAIAEHAWTHGHQINWTSQRSWTVNLWSTKLLESWHIHLQNPRMNTNKGTLPSFYLPLIETDKTRLQRGVSNDWKSVRTHIWCSNTTSINKDKSNKLPSITEQVCWIAFETSRITSKTCVQYVRVKEINMNPPGCSSAFKSLFFSKQ